MSRILSLHNLSLFYWFHKDLTLLLNLVEQGKIKPVVAERMPLNQADQAHELLAGGSVKGKIVLFCND